MLFSCQLFHHKLLAVISPNLKLNLTVSSVAKLRRQKAQQAFRRTRETEKVINNESYMEQNGILSN